VNLRMLGYSLLLGILSLGVVPAHADDGAAGALPAVTSPKAMMDGASDAISEMSTAADDLQKVLEDVQKRGDADAAQCVSLQLAKIKALLEVSRDAQGAMTQALADGLEQRADHEYRKIQIAVGKVRQFLADGHACEGGGAGASKDNTVVTTEWALAQVTDETQPKGDSDGVVGVDPPGTTSFE